MPTGKRYIGAVFAERAYNDVAGRSLIQDISRTVYQPFKYYQPRLQRNQLKLNLNQKKIKIILSKSTIKKQLRCILIKLIDNLAIEWVFLF